MLTASSIFFGSKSSTLVLDLYGLMGRILYVIFITPHCNSNMPLTKHCVITKGPLYGVSYLYAVWLVRMTFLQLYSHIQVYVYPSGRYLY